MPRTVTQPKVRAHLALGDTDYRLSAVENELLALRHAHATTLRRIAEMQRDIDLLKGQRLNASIANDSTASTTGHSTRQK